MYGDGYTEGGYKMRRGGTSDGERAVSEAISYVLIFGLIALGTAIVVFQGTPALETTEQQQIDENSERAIILVQERLDEMVRENAPTREVSVEAQDITVLVGGMDETSLNITAHEGGEAVSYTSTASPVGIETGSYTVAYENGAVVVGQQGIDGSWAMESDPSWAISTNETDYVQSAFVRSISTTGNSQVRGDGRHRFKFESISEINENLNDVDHLNITVNSPRRAAWESYLGRLDSGLNGTDIITDGDRVTLEVEEFNGSGRMSYDETVLQAEVESG